MADSFLGIDLGTTSVKAAVLDQAGRCIASFSESHPMARPGAGLAEQDPAHWMDLIDRCLTSFAAQGVGPRISQGALTSQVNTHIFVDRFGDPLLPAIVWQDTRATLEAAELDARLSEAEKIEILGAPIPIDASHPLARMLWVQRHHPDIWEKTTHVLLPKDFAFLKLTGNIVTDPLSNIGLVGEELRYADRILDLVPGAAERMAPLAGLTETIGTTGTSTALPGVPMANATMDGWVGLMGAGATTDGECVYLSGTSEILGIASHTVTNQPGIIVFAEAEGIRIHTGPTQSGAASQSWFCDVAHLDIEEMSNLVASTPRRAPTPLFLPQLAGERAPLWNPDLRGAFLALDAGMTTADFARGVYEGVAFSARHVLDALSPSADVYGDTLRCGGGGFRSDAWAQIRADILGKRLMRLGVNEPGIVGAVCIAAVAHGSHATLAEAHGSFARYDREWEPDPKNRDLYDALFEIYKDAIDTNAQISGNIAGVHHAR